MDNTKLKSVKIEGKDYYTAPSRIAEFRRICPNHELTTTYEVIGDFVIATSTIYTGKQAISNGITAKKIVSDSDFATAETLSKGRAIANFGIGMVEDVASAEEIEGVVLDGKLNKPGQALKELAEKELDKKK